MLNTEEIVQGLVQYQPAQDNWLGLDQLLEQLWTTKEPQQGIDALFNVFERFPEGDGNGVFWTILHGLEGLPTYELALVGSVRRQPMEFNVLMVNRILNTSQDTVGNIDGLALLKEVLVHPQATPAARQQAERYIERHESPA